MSQLLSNTSVKVFFGTKLPPNFYLGGLCTPSPPAHCSAACTLPFKEAVSQLSGLFCSYCVQINLRFWETAHLPLP